MGNKLSISIHALLTESDVSLAAIITTYNSISIHALLTESDIRSDVEASIVMNFNPRSPHGERHGARSLGRMGCTFQSTLSSRRATWKQYKA